MPLFFGDNLMNNDQTRDNKALQDLLENVKNGNCILFLGAGIHTPPSVSDKFTYPLEQRPLLGKSLALELAKECGFQKKFPEDEATNLQRVALCYEISEGFGRKKLIDTLKIHLMKDKKPSPALKMLADLPFKIIVTTNYDRLLEHALIKGEKDPKVIVYNHNPSIPTEDMDEDPTTERPLIFKTHGDLDFHDSIVITDEDYINFIQRMTDKEPFNPIPQTVRYRMQRWPTLFIGYSMNDYNLRLLFQILRWRIDKAKIPPSYSIDRNPDPLILQVWQYHERFITFVIEDIWNFVPWLFKKVTGREY